MITAKEAASNYNSNLMIADKFVAEVIEPKIKAVMQSSKEIKLPGADLFCVGYSMLIDKKWMTGDFQSSRDVDITSQIYNILQNAGYNVSARVVVSGNEYQNGVVEFTIDWREPHEN